jgi:hypothetical protein
VAAGKPTAAVAAFGVANDWSCIRFLPVKVFSIIPAMTADFDGVIPKRSCGKHCAVRQREKAHS